MSTMMTQAQFESDVLRQLLLIRGARKHEVEVKDSVITASCEIGGLPYEVSYVFGNEVEKQQAYAHVMRAVLDAVRRYGSAS